MTHLSAAVVATGLLGQWPADAVNVGARLGASTSTLTPSAKRLVVRLAALLESAPSRGITDDGCASLATLVHELVSNPDRAAFSDLLASPPAGRFAKLNGDTPQVITCGDDDDFYDWRDGASQVIRHPTTAPGSSTQSRLPDSSWGHGCELWRTMFVAASPPQRLQLVRDACRHLTAVAEAHGGAGIRRPPNCLGRCCCYGEWLFPPSSAVCDAVFSPTLESFTAYDSLLRFALSTPPRAATGTAEEACGILEVTRWACHHPHAVSSGILHAAAAGALLHFPARVPAVASLLTSRLQTAVSAGGTPSGLQANVAAADALPAVVALLFDAPPPPTSLSTSPIAGGVGDIVAGVRSALGSLSASLQALLFRRIAAEARRRAGHSSAALLRPPAAALLALLEEQLSSALMMGNYSLGGGVDADSSDGSALPPPDDTATTTSLVPPESLHSRWFAFSPPSVTGVTVTAQLRVPVHELLDATLAVAALCCAGGCSSGSSSSSSTCSGGFTACRLPLQRLQATLTDLHRHLLSGPWVARLCGLASHRWQRESQPVGVSHTCNVAPPSPALLLIVDELYGVMIEYELSRLTLQSSSPPAARDVEDSAPPPVSATASFAEDGAVLAPCDEGGVDAAQRLFGCELDASLARVLAITSRGGSASTTPSLTSDQLTKPILAHTRALALLLCRDTLREGTRHIAAAAAADLDCAAGGGDGDDVDAAGVSGGAGSRGLRGAAMRAGVAAVQSVLRGPEVSSLGGGASSGMNAAAATVVPRVVDCSAPPYPSVSSISLALAGGVEGSHEAPAPSSSYTAVVDVAGRLAGPLLSPARARRELLLRLGFSPGELGEEGAEDGEGGDAPATDHADEFMLRGGSAFSLTGLLPWMGFVATSAAGAAATDGGGRGASGSITAGAATGGSASTSAVGDDVLGGPVAVVLPATLARACASAPPTATGIFTSLPPVSYPFSAHGASLIDLAALVLFGSSGCGAAVTTSTTPVPPPTAVIDAPPHVATPPRVLWRLISRLLAASDAWVNRRLVQSESGGGGGDGGDVDRAKSVGDGVEAAFLTPALELSISLLMLRTEGTLLPPPSVAAAVEGKAAATIAASSSSLSLASSSFTALDDAVGDFCAAFRGDVRVHMRTAVSLPAIGGGSGAAASSLGAEADSMALIDREAATWDLHAGGVLAASLQLLHSQQHPVQPEAASQPVPLGAPSVGGEELLVGSEADLTVALEGDATAPGPLFPFLNAAMRARLAHTITQWAPRPAPQPTFRRGEAEFANHGSSSRSSSSSDPAPSPLHDSLPFLGPLACIGLWLLCSLRQRLESGVTTSTFLAVLRASGAALDGATTYGEYDSASAAASSSETAGTVLASAWKVLSGKTSSQPMSPTSSSSAESSTALSNGPAHSPAFLWVDDADAVDELRHAATDAVADAEAATTAVMASTTSDSRPPRSSNSIVTGISGSNSRVSPLGGLGWLQQTVTPLPPTQAVAPASDLQSSHSTVTAAAATAYGRDGASNVHSADVAEGAAPPLKSPTGSSPPASLSPILPHSTPCIAPLRTLACSVVWDVLSSFSLRKPTLVGAALSFLAEHGGLRVALHSAHHGISSTLDAAVAVAITKSGGDAAARTDHPLYHPLLCCGGVEGGISSIDISALHARRPAQKQQLASPASSPLFQPRPLSAAPFRVGRDAVVWGCTIQLACGTLREALSLCDGALTPAALAAANTATSTSAIGGGGGATAYDAGTEGVALQRGGVAKGERGATADDPARAVTAALRPVNDGASASAAPASLPHAAIAAVSVVASCLYDAFRCRSLAGPPPPSSPTVPLLRVGHSSSSSPLQSAARRTDGAGGGGAGVTAWGVLAPPEAQRELLSLAVSWCEALTLIANATPSPAWSAPILRHTLAGAPTLQAVRALTSFLRDGAAAVGAPGTISPVNRSAEGEEGAARLHHCIAALGGALRRLRGRRLQAAFPQPLGELEAACASEPHPAAAARVAAQSVGGYKQSGGVGKKRRRKRRDGGSSSRSGDSSGSGSGSSSSSDDDDDDDGDSSCSGNEFQRRRSGGGRGSGGGGGGGLPKRGRGRGRPRGSKSATTAPAAAQRGANSMGAFDGPASTSSSLGDVVRAGAGHSAKGGTAEGRGRRGAGGTGGTPRRRRNDPQCSDCPVDC